MSEPDRFFAEVIGHRLECERYKGDPDLPEIVLLHEGLGSVAMWKDFPRHLHERTGRSLLVYSRYGYGKSTPCTTHPVGDRYMHREALEVLPDLLDQLGITNPVLVGHSDGGSISLIHAGGSGRQVSVVVTLAAHVFNEEVCVKSIEEAKRAFETTPLKDRLARYHDDPEGAFWMWNQAWLAPSFWHWNIEEYLPKISCPAMVLQGHQDEYGTPDQVDAIASQVGGIAEAHLIEECRHSPHKDQEEQVLTLIDAFLEVHSR